MEKAKVNRHCANTGLPSLYVHYEPILVISMPHIVYFASHTHCHTGRQKRVKVELSNPVLPILPPVFGFVVLETKPF